MNSPHGNWVSCSEEDVGRHSSVRMKLFFRGQYMAALFAGAFCFLAGDAAANPHFHSLDEAGPTLSRLLSETSIRPTGKCATAPLQGVEFATVISAARIGDSGDTAAYCEVRGIVGNATQFVLYLPERWNGRIYMHGNGGFAGEPLDAPLGHRARLKAVRLGFMAVFTNTGHEAAAAPDGRWALDEPSRELDFAMRAVHQTIETAKAVAQRHYGRASSRSYFDGCSTGGRQGLIAAQRYPQDFDGILAGAPVLDMTSMLWKYWSNQSAIAAKPISEDTLRRLGSFIFDRYDGVDGLRDGVIIDPDAVAFNPASDLPATGLGPPGFSPDEIETLAAIYQPLIINGVDHFPGQPVGSERSGLLYSPETLAPIAPQSPWLTRVVPDARGTLGQRGLVQTWFRFMAFTPDRPDLDWKALDLSTDFSRTANAGSLMNATDPDLSYFAARGGKLLMYHGWADFGVNPRRSIRYYDSAKKLLGARTDDVLRLYVVPGMFHCEGGLDVDRIDMLSPLIEWVESDRPPETLLGSRVEAGEVTRTRPVCRYPARLKYLGNGDGSRPEHFSCVLPDPTNPSAPGHLRGRR
jgi:hypothetical protein